MFRPRLLCAVAAFFFAACGSPPPAPPAKPKPITLNVVTAWDPGMTIPDDAMVDSALRMAERMIDEHYQIPVRFVRTRTVTPESYLAEKFEGFGVPDEWTDSLYCYWPGADDISRFLDRDPDDRDSAKFERFALADLMSSPLMRYEFTSSRRINRRILIREFHDKIMELLPFLLPSKAQQNNSWFYYSRTLLLWDMSLELIIPESITENLVLVNLPLIDNNLNHAVPHTLIRGGLTNGISRVEAPQAIVSVFPIMCDSQPLTQWRDAQLTGEEKVASIAHIIAHEFGSHGLMHFHDVYNHKGCLAVPTKGLAFRGRITDVIGQRPCDKAHPVYDTAPFLAWRYQTLTECSLAVGNDTAAWRYLRRGRELLPENAFLKDYEKWIRNEGPPL